MKKAFSILAIAFAAVDTASAAAYLAQTKTDEWAVNRDVVLVSGTTASGAVTNSATLGVLSVGKYTGSDELVRVRITYVQPDPAESAIINASITIAAGSDTFTSSTVGNRVTETTTLRFSDALATSLDSAGHTVSDPASIVQRNSANYANTGISVGSPIARSVNLSVGPTVLFDSDNVSSITLAELASIFQGAGTVGFGFDTTSTFNWSRTGAVELTATLSGTNSGQIIIQYYAIPEPSAALLGCLGALGLLRRRR